MEEANNNVATVDVSVYKEKKKKSLYTHLVLTGRVLKCTIDEVIELVSGLDQLKTLPTQSGNLFLDEMALIKDIVKEKIIIKYSEAKPEESTNDDIYPRIYWSPCSIIDFLAISGITFNQTGNLIFEFDKNKGIKTSFFGKDIIKAFDDIAITGDVDTENIEFLQEVLQCLADVYITCKYHISNTNYYSIGFDSNDETGENNIVINRDLKNSPRPQHTKDKSAEENDEGVQKTYIKINK